MELIADTLLVAGAIGAGFYCYVLAQRLSRFNDLEKGVGGAVAALSKQVDNLSQALDAAQSTSGASNEALSDLTNRAEAVTQRLELMMASLHDLPSESSNEASKPQSTNSRVQSILTANQRESGRNDAAAPQGNGPMFMRHDRPKRQAAQ